MGREKVSWIARKGRLIFVAGVGAAIVVAPSGLRAASTTVMAESVDQYNACFPGADTFFRVADAQGFLNNMMSPGTMWTQGANWQNGNVWDTDFTDQDIGQFGNDTNNFDAPGLAFSMFAGHGNCEDTTTQFCTSSSQCVTPAHNWQFNPGYCISGPDRSRAACVYDSPRHLYTCGNNDQLNHRVDYSSGAVALGESSNSGAWRRAGTNGGTNFAIFDISCAVRPNLQNWEVWNTFGGMHNLATLMPTDTHSDAWDSSERGSLFAAYYTANPYSAPGVAWQSMINSVPSTEGATCDNVGGYHGFAGCGANIVISLASTASVASWMNQYQNWIDVSSDGNDSTAGSSMKYSYVCNYDCVTYPPVL
jgi:hypothetical protein